MPVNFEEALVAPNKKAARRRPVFHGQIWEASASVARPFAQVFAHSWRTRFCLKLAPVALIERDQ
jgi:hypothetical protein